MKAVIQRVSEASVTVDGVVTGEIGPGLVILLGVTHGDETADADYLVDKIINLRIFNDAEGKMNRSLGDAGGKLLVVSQFTLYGNTRKGRRPSFIEAAAPELAEQLYDYFIRQAKAKGVGVEKGVFGAMMTVKIFNDGPVTIIIDSGECHAPRNSAGG